MPITPQGTLRIVLGGVLSETITVEHVMEIGAPIEVEDPFGVLSLLDNGASPCQPSP